MEHTVYLDNAATTFPKPEEVYEALDMANRELAFNAGRGTYNLAKKATDLIETTKKQIPGSVSFVPSCAGLMIAGEVIKDLIK